MPDTPLTANDVRRLAEALDGYRGDPVQVVLRDGALVWLPNGEQPKTGDRPLFDVQTKDTNPARPALKAIRLEPMVTAPGGGDAVDDVLTVFDALFWTEAAVSKFVLPYYMRFYSPEDVHKLWLAFLGMNADGTLDGENEILAFGHLPFSEPSLVESTEGGAYDTMALVMAEPVAVAEAAGPPGAAVAAAARPARSYRVVTARQFLAGRAR